MNTTTTVTATVTTKDGTAFRTFVWKGRRIAPHLQRIRARLKAEGATTVAFGRAISVYNFGAH